MGSALARRTCLSNLPADVAGREPAVLDRLARIGLRAPDLGHPGAAALDLAESDSIPGQLLSGRNVHDSELDAGRRNALRETVLQLVLGLDPGWNPGDA